MMLNGRTFVSANMSEPTSSSTSTAYLKHREILEASRLAVCRDRDKLILAIAGGSLAVSVTLLERVVHNLNWWLTLILVLGWTLEVVAVAVVLLSLHSSEQALWHERERVDCILAGDGRDPEWKNHHATRTERLNSLASACAVAGLALILLQAALSLWPTATSAGSMSVGHSPSALVVQPCPGVINV